MTTISNRRISFEGMEIEGTRVLYIKWGSFLRFLSQALEYERTVSID